MICSNGINSDKFIQNFVKELSNYSKNDITIKYNNLLLDDLILYDNKITTKYRDKMLLERANILKDYANNVKDDMYYIYNNSNEENSYNLCSCNKNHEVITKTIEELPDGSKLGSILRKKDDIYILDVNSTKIVGKRINNMIIKNIEEQKKYLDSKRIDGHKYEVGEKYFDRIWLYDLNNTVNGEVEGIEEIEFPKELYKNAKEGDLFIYEKGEYHKSM